MGIIRLAKGSYIYTDVALEAAITAGYLQGSLTWLQTLCTMCYIFLSNIDSHFLNVICFPLFVMKVYL